VAPSIINKYLCWTHFHFELPDQYSLGAIDYWVSPWQNINKSRL